MKKITNPKYQQLIDYLKSLGSVAVAFSGGVDSTLLIYAANEALGSNAVAINVQTTYVAGWEIEEAVEFTKQHGIRQENIFLEIPESIENNPTDRCYLCKKAIFTNIKIKAELLGFKHVLDGTNTDDLSDYRPGLKALRELEIISPFLECGIDKQTIRDISKQLELPTWDKPAYACLLSRIPYNVAINEEELRRIEKSEKYLMDKGYKAIRVRSHGNVARLELPPHQRHEFVEDSLAAEVYYKLQSFGYDFVSLDLLGYRTGSLNETILKNND